MLVVFLLCLEAFRCLKLGPIHSGKIVWDDPGLLIFRCAQFTSPETVKSLGYLLNSANPHSEIIGRRYNDQGGCLLTKDFWPSLIYYFPILSAYGKVKTGHFRKFINLECLSRLKDVERLLRHQNIRKFLLETLPFNSSPDVWSKLPNELISGLLERSTENPDSGLKLIRQRNGPILPYSMKPYTSDLRPFFLLLDYSTIGAVQKTFSESIIDCVFMVPINLDDIRRSVVFMVHFITSVSCFRIVDGRPLSFQFQGSYEFRRKLELMMRDSGGMKEQSDFLHSVHALECFSRWLVQAEDTNCSSSFTKKSVAIIRYFTSDRFLIMGPVSRARFDLELMALNFVCHDFELQEEEEWLDEREAQSLIRSIFRIPQYVNPQVLIMVVIILSDYGDYSTSALKTLQLIFGEVKRDRKLSFALLASKHIPKTTKQMLDWKWRKSYFLHSIEILPKMLLHQSQGTTTRFECLYEKYLQALMEKGLSKSFQQAFNSQDIASSKTFLLRFIPWLLSRKFLAVVNHNNELVYERPKLSVHASQYIVVLAEALQTAMAIGVPLKVKLGKGLLEKLQNHLGPFGGQNFRPSEFKSFFYQV